MKDPNTFPKQRPHQFKNHGFSRFHKTPRRLHSTSLPTSLPERTAWPVPGWACQSPSKCSPGVPGSWQMLCFLPQNHLRPSYEVPKKQKRQKGKKRRITKLKQKEQLHSDSIFQCPFQRLATFRLALFKDLKATPCATTTDPSATTTRPPQSA